MLGTHLRLVGGFQPIRVLVADDSVSDRNVIQDVLGGLNDVEVVGTARDGREAIDKVQLLEPDVAFIDVRLPLRSGLEVFRELRGSRSHSRVVLLSDSSTNEVQATIDALFAGVFDFVMKPDFKGNRQVGVERLQRALRDRIKAFLAADANNETGPSSASNRGIASGSSTTPINTCNAAVALGASTGGPGALRQLLSVLPGDFPAPVLIAHPMPAAFTRPFAERLNEVSALTVREATVGDFVLPGTVLLAPGGQHMEVDENGGEVRIKLTGHLPLHGYRPVVDRLFKSVASLFGPDALGVVLSGFGCDGTEGCRAIREAGGRVLVQDKQSLVSEMPQSVARAGLANEVLPIGLMGLEIMAQIGESMSHLV